MVIIMVIDQAIRFFMSNNLTVEGLRIRDSPKFHFRFDNCSSVYIDSIRITAPPLSPNTDGIHIENTDNVQIYNSVIANGTYHSAIVLYLYLLLLYRTHSKSCNTFVFIFLSGDDCVSIGSGCYDVDIRNLTCGPGHGIRYTFFIVSFSLFTVTTNIINGVVMNN